MPLVRAAYLFMAISLLVAAPATAQASEPAPRGHRTVQGVLHISVTVVAPATPVVTVRTVVLPINQDGSQTGRFQVQQIDY
jgi:hypothetical protein